MPLRLGTRHCWKSLPAPDASRPALGTPFVAPRTPIESTLARFFREVLKVERVGVLDDFVALGGDSLSAVELFVRIEHEFAVQFPLATLFKVPTIAGLAEELERARAAGPAESPGAQPSRTRPAVQVAVTDAQGSV